MDKSDLLHITHTQEERPFIWIDESYANWIQQSWGCSHTVIAGIAFIFYAIPMIIFFAIKWYCRKLFLDRVEEVRTEAFRITGAKYLAPFIHLGGHPKLPFRARVLVGLKGDSICFYDLYLKTLHAAPCSSIRIGTETRHITASSVGSVYQFGDSGVGTSVSTTNVEICPDTVILQVPLNGETISAVFDVRPYDPLRFIQIVNDIKTRHSQ